MVRITKSKTLLWIARVIGLIASVVAIWFIVSKGLAPENKGNNQIITINVMMVFLIFGFLIGWFREREGGIIMTFGSIMLYLYLSYLPPTLLPYRYLYILAFMIPGISFLYLSYLMSGKKKDED